MSNVLTARIRFFIFPPPSPHRDNNSPWAADRALIIEKYPRYRMESLLDTLKNSHQKGERRLPTKQYPSSSSSSKFPTTRLQPLDTSPRIITFRTSKSGGDINGRGSKGGGRFLFFRLFFDRAQFHGQYREIYRAAVCDDILRVEAGGWRGPTHGGALDVTPYVWPPWKRDGTGVEGGGGRARRAP